MTNVQLFTLAIAILSLLISLVALTWQIVAWRLSGSVVKVDLLAGAFGNGGVASNEVSKFDFKTFAQSGFLEPVFIVRARNVGRIPVDITHWKVTNGSGFGYTLPDYAPNPTLPTRLEAGSSVDFFLPMREVLDVFKKMSTRRRIAAKVTLATGKDRESGLDDLPVLHERER